MRKSTNFVLVLIFSLLLLLPACNSLENMRGDIDNRSALRICIDINGYAGEGDFQRTQDIRDFMFSLKETGGLEGVVFEVIPRSGPERNTAIKRIRTELMAGGGPDVFIVDCTLDADEQKSLFPFPDKVMEAGLFLPLDKYMENKTEFTEWDKQQAVVLAAGRNEEGQQIIPLSYTFPVQTCNISDFVMAPRESLLTWQDTLTDPVMVDAYAEFIDCVDVSWGRDMHGQEGLYRFVEPYLEHSLGKLADFHNEELLFTEDELLQRIHEILVLIERNNYEDNCVFTNQFMGSSVVGGNLTMMPMYSDDGGICVSIRNFVAVNRNTKHPEEAYRVVDVLLSEQSQLTKPLYRLGICASGTYANSIPLCDMAFHKDTPFAFRCFSDESYEIFKAVKGQITAANFRSSLSDDLNMLLMRCTSEEDLVVIEALVHNTYESMKRKVRE